MQSHQKNTSISSIGSHAETEEVNTLGFDLSDHRELENHIFSAIHDGDREGLAKIFKEYPSSTTIVQQLLMIMYPNRDGLLRHDESILADANELLGPSIEHLNAIQMACFMGDEEIALDILEFFVRVTEEEDAKKLLYEFMGRLWGDSNTTLHLASFMGMCDLVKRLIELGAATTRINDKMYRPVDCADDEETMRIFEKVEGPKGMKEVTLDEKRNAAVTDIKNVNDSSSSVNRSEVTTSNPTLTRSGTAESLSATSSLRLKAHLPKASSFNMLNKLSQKKKSVRFNPATLLLHVCQHPASVDDPLSTLKSCLSSSELKDINQIFSPHQWLTPLHVACSHGNVDIAKIILEAGSYVNVYDKEGWTPLHCASAEGHIEIIHLLGRCQGKLGEKGQDGWINVIDGPIDLEPVNEDGDMPEDIAFEFKQTEIHALLNELKRKYPPPPRPEPEEKDEENSSEDIEETEQSQSSIITKNGNLVNLDIERSSSVKKYKSPSTVRTSLSFETDRSSEALHPDPKTVHLPPFSKLTSTTISSSPEEIPKRQEPLESSTLSQHETSTLIFPITIPRNISAIVPVSPINQIKDISSVGVLAKPLLNLTKRNDSIPTIIHHVKRAPKSDDEPNNINVARDTDNFYSFSSPNPTSQSRPKFSSINHGTLIPSPFSSEANSGDSNIIHEGKDKPFTRRSSKSGPSFPRPTKIVETTKIFEETPLKNSFFNQSMQVMTSASINDKVFAVQEFNSHKGISTSTASSLNNTCVDAVKLPKSNKPESKAFKVETKSEIKKSISLENQEVGTDKGSFDSTQSSADRIDDSKIGSVSELKKTLAFEMERKPTIKSGAENDTHIVKNSIQDRIRNFSSKS